MNRLKKKDMKKLLDAVSTAVENSRKNPQVMEKIAEFGFTEESLQTGEDLHKQAEELYLAKGAKTGKKISVNIQLREKIDKIHGLYMVYVKLLRRELREDPALYREFDLAGKRDISLSGKVKDPKGFYEQCLKNEKLAYVAAKFGLTQEKIQSHLIAIADIEKDRQYKALVIKEKEKSTVDRHEIFQKLKDWWIKFKTVLIYVFADDPQQLEAFEIKAYTPGYDPHKKSEPVTEVVEDPGVPAIAATAS